MLILKYFPGFFLILLFSFLYMPTFGQKLSKNGRLIGIVISENNEKLTGASVSIKSQNSEEKFITSNINGEFEFDLQPGKYILTVTYVGYEKFIDSTVIVEIGNVSRLSAILKYLKEKEGVVVSASRRNKESVASLLTVQKNNASVSDVMGAEQIRRTPDVTVGDAIKRMNGVTVVDNKFVVVRGMSDRYNTLLLNGSQVPSTETGRKNFSLDLIPSSAIENIVVIKTATPDLPADFSGGVIQVTTKEIPEKNTFSISAGIGYNTLSTGKEYISTKIYRRQYFTAVHPTYNWYFKRWDPNRYLRVEEPKVMGARIPNTWGLYKYIALPTQTYQFNLGLRKKMNNGESLGFLLSGAYRNEQAIADDFRRTNGSQDSTTGSIKSFTTDINLLASLNYSFKKTKINWKNFYSRKLSQDFNEFSGLNTNVESIDAFTSYQNLVSIIQSRLEGEHQLTFLNARFKWFGDFSKVNRDLIDGRISPRFFVGESVPGYEFSDTRPNSGGVSGSKFDELRRNAGLELSIPLNFWNQKHSFKMGGAYSNREVESNYTFLRYLFDPSYSVSEVRDQTLGLPLNMILTRYNLTNRGLIYRPVSSTSTAIVGGVPGGGSSLTFSDFYSGSQSNISYYFMGDFNINDYLRVIGGLRYEGNNMNIETVTSRDNEGKVISTAKTDLIQNAFYPSINLVYKVNPKMNLRTAFSNTTARPDFREAVPLGYYDFVNFFNVIGNKDIKNTRISNLDLRFEFYPKAQEILSATLFYKKFIDPIEQNLTNDGSGNFIVTPVNLESSTNIGFEFDIRKSLSFFSKRSKFLKNTFIYGNYSYMVSEVLLEGSFSGFIDAKDRSRPLQGLSPYSINGGLLHSGEKYGFNIVYNRFGRRILFQGDQAFEDVYENPRDVIDFQFFVKFFNKKMEAKFNLSDLLNQPFILYSNVADNGFNQIDFSRPNTNLNYNAIEDFVRRKTFRGTSLSVTVNYKL